MTSKESEFMCEVLTKCIINDIATEFFFDKFEEKIIKPLFKIFETYFQNFYLYSFAEQFRE